MHSEQETARAIAHEALPAAGCTCATRGVHFVGREGNPIGEAGGDLIFEATCCKIQLVLSDVGDEGGVPNAVVYRRQGNRRALVQQRESVTVEEMRGSVLGQLLPIAAVQRDRRLREEAMLDAEARQLLRAAGCAHQDPGPDESRHTFYPYLEHPPGGEPFYKLVCANTECDKVATLAIHRAVELAPTVMAHHEEDLREAAKARGPEGAESLLEAPLQPVVVTNTVAPNGEPAIRVEVPGDDSDRFVAGLVDAFKAAIEPQLEVATIATATHEELDERMGIKVPLVECLGECGKLVNRIDPVGCCPECSVDPDSCEPYQPDSPPQ